MPNKVFTNIISWQVEWHEDWVDLSDKAHDFMAKLMVTDALKQLGANGADEVKAHPFLTGVEWDKVTKQEAQFIPQVTDPKSTNYFDPWGAVLQLFQDDEGHLPQPIWTESPASDFLGQSMTVPVAMVKQDMANSPVADDFGVFNYKNVPVLKQANDDVIHPLPQTPFVTGQPDPDIDTPVFVTRDLITQTSLLYILTGSDSGPTLPTHLDTPIINQTFLPVLILVTLLPCLSPDPTIIAQAMTSRSLGVENPCSCHLLPHPDFQFVSCHLCPFLSYHLTLVYGKLQPRCNFKARAQHHVRDDDDTKVNHPP